MSSRIRETLMVVGGFVAALILAAPSAAVDTHSDYWQGDTSNVWNVATNWYAPAAPSPYAYVPQSSSVHLRAVIGTDNPNGAMNTLNAPFGSPVLTTTPTPAAKATIEGIYLGVRERDYATTGTPFVRPTDNNLLVGKLTITGGSIACVSGFPGYGADGRIVVGADGRGYLNMTGGTLTGLALVVGGATGTVAESTDEGLSYVDLSGTATVNIANASAPSSAVSTFGRRLYVSGPNVNYNSAGNIRFQSDNMYTARITGATHSALKTDSNVIVGGGLTVEYSGATPVAYGATWNLFDYAGGTLGSFNNLSAGGDVPITGVPTPVPGEVYRLRSGVAGGTKGKLIQLVHDKVLVLHVNRDTGELSVTNPLGGSIDIDGYSIDSSVGSLLTSYKGISGAPAGDTGWEKVPVPQTPNSLAELKNAVGESLDLTSIPSLTLGTGFDKLAVAGDIANFGNDGEDLVFTYTDPDSSDDIYGQVVYEGTKFENNLVVRVNPTSGLATIKNDSQETLTFDGYSIMSSTGNLSGTSWTGLGGTWSKTTPSSATALSETNLLGSLTLDPGEEAAIGDISSTGFAPGAAQDGLSMQFILAEGLVSGAPEGDFNGDGTVDAADYTVWRDGLGTTYVEADYDVWKANFGSTGSVVPETTYRDGSIFFDSTLVAGSGSLEGAAVPEPGTGVLLLTGLASLLFVRRGAKRPQSTDAAATRSLFDQSGVHKMRKQLLFCLMVVVGVSVALCFAAPAAATTQGITLSNYTFDLPARPTEKTYAYDWAGTPIAGIVPGWTFPGPGLETFGHDGTSDADATIGPRYGDSGTQGGPTDSNRGNEMILSCLDGVAYQTATGFAVAAIPATQQYKLSFDTYDMWTVHVTGTPPTQVFTEVEDAAELTARIYYGAGRTTLTTFVAHPINPETGSPDTHYEFTIPSGSALLTPALGQSIGIEFECTSDTYNTEVNKAWVGVDNVVMEITGVLAGDLDGDGDVDTADYNIVRNSQQVATPFESGGELTGDNFVDLDDFRAFKALYAAAAGAGAGAASAAGQVPEPSTLALAAIVAVALGGLKLRRRLPMLLLAVFSLGAILATASPSSAELKFYDPFLIGTNPAAGEYVAGDHPTGTLAGQSVLAPYGTDTNFFSGAWSAPDADQGGGVVNATGLSFIGAPSLGGSAQVLPIPNPTPPPDMSSYDGRTGRYLETDWTDETVGTYYLSFLANFGTTTTNMGYRSVEFWPVGNDIGTDSGRMDIGYNQWGSGGAVQQSAATARMCINVDAQTQQIFENAPLSYNEDGVNHLIVVKFEMTDVAAADGDGDEITVYLDPTTLTEPEIASAYFPDLDYTLHAMGTISQFGGGTTGIFDELRVATTYAEAVPDFPMPGDTDMDDDVDLVDYATITSHFNQDVTGGPGEGDVALANGMQGSDGRVTLADFRLWKDNRNVFGSGSLAGGAVPEPSSLVLVLAAALALAGYARRAR